jgi:murein L,D-transpeptidase YcbB/YkuD
LRAWISRQEKHVVSGFRRVPLFIRYYTVESDGVKMKFYEDIYGLDQELLDKYFGKKAVS